MMLIAASLILLLALVMVTIALGRYRANRPRRMMRWAVRRVAAMSEMERHLFRMRRRAVRFQIVAVDRLTPIMQQAAAGMSRLAQALSE